MNEPTPERLREVSEQAREIFRTRLAEPATRTRFAGDVQRTEVDQPPLVLVIGNHSSGKSSFINMLLGEEVQRTAQAPMDDGFTLLSRGDASAEFDGQSVVSNADLPWGGLEDFGPTLVNHLVMKTRPCEILRAITLVDSPGMIDARVNSGADSRHDRGYDFLGVVRWFAERADVILLFFDPDNPGTTGETLQVLNEALRDMDHKLELVLNKVDRFSDHRDFARGYGALCWNLARAIPRLDLPHINLTYLPGGDRPTNHLPLEDFDRNRGELVEKVRRAPARRVDNIVTRLYQDARALRVHARVVEEARGELFRRLWGGRAAALASGLLLGGAAAGVQSLAPQATAAVVTLGGLGGLLLVAGVLLAGLLARRREQELRDSLNRVFEQAFREELALGTNSEDLRALWERVRPRTRRVFESTSVLALPRVRRADFAAMDEAIRDLLPGLRARIHEPVAGPN